MRQLAKARSSYYATLFLSGAVLFLVVVVIVLVVALAL
jgi:hypothetical protein